MLSLYYYTQIGDHLHFECSTKIECVSFNHQMNSKLSFNILSFFTSLRLVLFVSYAFINIPFCKQYPFKMFIFQRLAESLANEKELTLKMQVLQQENNLSAKQFEAKLDESFNRNIEYKAKVKILTWYLLVYLLCQPESMSKDLGFDLN